MSKLDGGGVGDKSILQLMHSQAGKHVKEKTLLWIRAGEGKLQGATLWKEEAETKVGLRIGRVSNSLAEGRVRGSLTVPM